MPDPVVLPKPTIYLRNRLRLKGDVLGQPDAEPPIADVFNTASFLRGKEGLIRRTKENQASLGAWKLIAAAGERPLLMEDRLFEPSTDLLQIWELGEWSTLANSIYTYSEASWYRALGESLADEGQELLVNLTSGSSIEPRPRWLSDTEPGYTYLYEEATTPLGLAHAYLRDLTWFSAQLESQFAWKRVWAAGQITARPAVMCTLWAVPHSGTDVNEAIAWISREESSRARYARLMSSASNVSRELLHPIYTERLDELISGGAPEPIIP